MDIRLVVSPTEPEMVDAADSTGLTEAGYEALVRALTSAGFEIADGPEAEQ